MEKGRKETSGPQQKKKEKEKERDGGEKEKKGGKAEPLSRAGTVTLTRTRNGKLMESETQKGRHEEEKKKKTTTTKTTVRDGGDVGGVNGGENGGGTEDTTASVDFGERRSPEGSDQGSVVAISRSYRNGRRIRPSVRPD